LGQVSPAKLTSLITGPAALPVELINDKYSM